MTAGVRQSAIGVISGTTAVATLGSATLAGSVILCILTQGDSAAITVTDNKSGGSSTYSQANPSVKYNWPPVALTQYTENSAAGITAVTATFSNSGESGAMLVLELTGCLTSGSFNTTASQTSSATSASDPVVLQTTMPAAAAQANNIVIQYAAGEEDGGNALSWSSAGGMGFTFINGLTSQAASYCPAAAYQVVSATTAITGDLRFTTSGANGGTIAGGILVFKAAADSGTTAALTADSITSTAGTVKPALAKAATGNSATLTPGTLKAAIAKALTGNTATTAPGTLNPTITVALSGVSIASAPGTVTPPGSTAVALSGVSIASAPGALSPALSVPLSGVSATSAPGTVVPVAAGNTTVALTGNAIAAAPGQVKPAAVVALGGNSIAATPGTVAYGVRDVTIALTGNTIGSTAGTVAVQGAAPAARNMGFTMKGPPKKRLERTVKPQSVKAAERWAKQQRDRETAEGLPPTGPAPARSPSYSHAFDALPLRDAPLIAPALHFNAGPAWMAQALLDVHQHQQALALHVEQLRRKRQKDDEEAIAALLAAF